MKDKLAEELLAKVLGWQPMDVAEERPVLGRPAGGRGPARVDHHQVGAVPLALQHVLEHNRVRLAGVTAPEDDAVGVLDLLV